MKKQKRIAVLCCCLVVILGLSVIGIQAGAGSDENQTEDSTNQKIMVEEIPIEEKSSVSENGNGITESEPEGVAESETEGLIEETAQAFMGDESKMQTEVSALAGEESEMQSETSAFAGEEPQESEYADFAIADVSNYVNVRMEPTTDSDIVGKMYDGAVAEIVSVAGEGEEWFQISSGSVEGYIKAEFFIYGQDAVAVMDEYVNRYAKVEADRLNVRQKPSTEEKRIGYIDNGEKVKLLEDCGEWLRVQYTDAQEGYVAAEYVTILEEYVYAKTLEEEQAELEAARELEAREAAKEEATPEVVTNVTFPTTTYTSSAELRQAIVDYALQYVGYPYVSGGRSLATGTDCSGFTCFVYADFGYSISRTPGGQLSSSGRSIDYSAIQPGDIICYSSNGGASCTHVGLYIGNGQIVHAANSRKGVITQNADYDLIVGIKNVVD